MALQVATWPARAVHVLLGLALVVAIVAGLAALGLAWRLAQGPLDVTWLLRTAESVMGTGLQSGLGQVRIGQATMAWNGFNGGGHSGLELRLRDVRTVGPEGQALASVTLADVTLAPLPLIAATVAPRRIMLDGVRIRAVRGLDGAVRLDAASDGQSQQTGDFGDVLAVLRRPAGSAGDDPALSALEHVIVEHARVTLVDEASDASVEGELAELDLRRQPAGGIVGTASGSFVTGRTTLALSMKAELLAAGGTHVEATLAPVGLQTVDIGALARLSPQLAVLGGLETSIGMQASLDLTAGLRPERATLHASAGPGTLSVPDSTPVTFDGASLQAAATWDGESWRPRTVKVDPAEAVLVVGGMRRSTARITLSAQHGDGQTVAQAALRFDRAQFGDLPALWPKAWGGHVRPWLTDNVTAGTAHDAAFTATIAIPDDDPGKAKVTAAGGTLEADEVVVHWLRPVPPIEHARAVLTVTGPDDLVIAVPRASQGPIALKDGVIRFTGLSHKDQYMALTATIQGAVPDVLKVLREPRLNLLSAHPIPITGSAGRAVAQLKLNVPMFDHLTFDQVSIASTGRLTGLRLDGLVAGRDLSHGDITYDVTQDGLTAAGAATVAGVAGHADVQMNFKSGPPTEVLQQARLVGRVGAAELAANGLGSGGLLTSGSAVVDTSYSEQRDGVSRVSVKADLTPAGLSALGWRKAPGAAARAAAVVTLRHGSITGVPQLTASGPGMTLAARATMVDGAPRMLQVEQFVLGPTRIAGEVEFPADDTGPIRVQVSGPVLDVSDQVGGLFDGGASGGAGRSFIADVRFGRVMLGHGRLLTDVAAHVERIGGRLQSVQATTGGKERVRASITPVQNGRRLLVQAADLGALLTGLDLTRTIQGGALSVDARYDDRFADPPLEGRIQLQNFGVKDAVIVGKLLQAVTVYGIVDALRDTGVYFAELQMPFCLCGQVVRLGPSRAFSSSLGITAKGWIDLDRKLIEIAGTVVPAYAVNAALGRLPFVGRLFSPERGGGLIAANFKVDGTLDRPSVSVNPFSLLTPGFLRQLFGLFS